MIGCKFAVVDVRADARHLVAEEVAEEDPVQGLQAGSWEEQQERLRNNDGKQKWWNMESGKMLWHLRILQLFDCDSVLYEIQLIMYTVMPPVWFSQFVL